MGHPVQPFYVDNNFRVLHFMREVQIMTQTQHTEKDYLEQLFKVLKSLQGEQILTDVTIKDGTKTVHTYKNILAAGSTYFEPIFLANNVSVVNIEGNIDVFNLFDFTKATDQPEDFVELVTTADRYNLKYALRLCSEKLLCHWRHGDLSMQQLYQMALSPDDVMSAAAKRTMSKSVSDLIIALSTKPDFVEHTTYPCLTLFLENVQRCQEQEVLLDVVMKWYKHDWPLRQVHIPNLLDRLRIGLLPTDKLKKLMEDVKDIPESQTILATVIELQKKDASTLACPSLQNSHPQWFLSRSSEVTLIQVGGAGKIGLGSKYLDNQWSWQEHSCVISPLPHRVCYHSAAVVNGHICVAGGAVYGPSGRLQRTPSRRFCFYDAIRHEWKPLASLSTARYNFALVHMNDFIFAIGGMGENGCLSDVECYSIAANHWQPVSPLPVACRDISAVIYKGSILVYGLEDGTDLYQLMIFTPDVEGNGMTGRWHRVLNDQKHVARSISTPKYVLTVQNDRVYRIVYADVLVHVENQVKYKQVPHSEAVCELEVNFDDTGIPHASVGTSHDQSNLHEHISIEINPENRPKNVFSIDGKLYANVLGCVYNLGLEEGEIKSKRSQFMKLDLQDNGTSVVLFMHDQ